MYSRKFDSVFNFDELLKLPEITEINKGNALQDTPAVDADASENVADLPEFTPQSDKDSATNAN